MPPMTIDWKSWAKRLQELRRERGWSQEELANRLGVTRNTVNRWEIGNRHPSMMMLERLAVVLGVPGNTLLPATQLRGQDPDATTRAYSIRFEARLLFALDADYSMTLARLMMATDDVRHIQRLLMVQYDPKNATLSEKAIIEGESGHLFRLLCGHLYEALDIFGNLDPMCRDLLDAAVSAPKSEADRARATIALERMRRGRDEVFSNKRSFIKVVRNLAGFHYPREDMLRRTITRSLRPDRTDRRLEGRVVLTGQQGIGRYTVTDDILKHLVADALGWPLDEHFGRAYMAAIGEAIQLAGALGDVVDFFLTHLVNRSEMVTQYDVDIIRIHPGIVRVAKRVERERRRNQSKAGSLTTQSAIWTTLPERIHSRPALVRRSRMLRVSPIPGTE